MSGKEEKEPSCGCGGDGGCLCGAAVYWCETCRAYFPEKRCPQCGLKLKKVRDL